MHDFIAMRLIALAIILMIAFMIFVAIASIVIEAQDGIAKRRCFSAAGRVEHYDADRPQVWRCVGSRAEGK